MATGAEWRVRIEALQAKVIELETILAIREAHMWEEIARALAREKEIW